MTTDEPMSDARRVVRAALAPSLPDELVVRAGQHLTHADDKRDTLIRVQCGLGRCRRTVGHVYRTPDGPLYFGYDSGDADHDVDAAAMAQHRRQSRETGDAALLYGLPAAFTPVTGRAPW